MVFEGRNAVGKGSAIKRIAEHLNPRVARIVALPRPMFAHTNIPESPWYVVESDDKRRARLNMIAHLLSMVPYYAVPAPDLMLPMRPPATAYQRPPKDPQSYVPDHAADPQAITPARWRYRKRVRRSSRRPRSICFGVR
ncbi:acetamidase regulator [Streptomyces sp. NBRC 110611]|nr:acetamidase regulator [Streptomyces sp. NBRC 110611]